jgi:hypothetical protein
MNALFSNLQNIKKERDKLSPAVIKEGLTVFGITGTLQYMVKTFATIEEMNSATNLPENTIGVVYGITYVGTYRLDNGEWTQIGDSTDEQNIMNTLNLVDGKADEFEEVGGTDEEINTVLEEILTGDNIPDDDLPEMPEGWM